MSDSTFTGGCQCGAIRYVLTGEPAFSGICHCGMCRKANAAPEVAWLMFPTDRVTFEKALPKEYESSKEAKRGFCSECGTQISFTAAYLPGLMDFTVGSLDDPEAYKPTCHYWYSRRLSWVAHNDGLPTHAEFPPE